MARTCNVCGRWLEPGEVCNCAQPVAGMPRDGLRARCPLFVARSSYRRHCYIVCSRADGAEPGKVEFGDSDARNAHYRRYCCGLYRLCGAHAYYMGGQDGQKDGQD